MTDGVIIQQGHLQTDEVLDEETLALRLAGGRCILVMLDSSPPVLSSQLLSSHHVVLSTARTDSNMQLHHAVLFHELSTVSLRA